MRVEAVFESTSETIWKNQRQASQIRKILLPLDLVFKTLSAHGSESVKKVDELKTIVRHGNAKILMGYEGQLGALATWLDRTYTGDGERPWMANTLKAHQDHSQRQGLMSFSFQRHMLHMI